MERLTARNKGNGAYYVNCFGDGAPCGGGMPGEACGDCGNDQKHCETLADYEDSGLTPERARELGRADAEGRLVVLKGKYTQLDGEEALRKAMHMVDVTNYPINRYIADAVAEKLVRDEAVLEANALAKLIQAQPTASVEPVRHVRWVDKCVRDWHCSECNFEVQKVRHFDGYCYKDMPTYCPNCGAKMDGEEGTP